MSRHDTITTPAAVSATALHLSYGPTQILRGIDVDLPEGRTLALLGPSGCGKTTLLRLVAGLLPPTSGEVRLGGTVVASSTVFVPPERRSLGMVFQDYALWPHLTVAGNVAFPLEMARVPKAERDTRVARALERVGLAEMADRSPSALSGGQQQRVAIARAIVAEPKIVLFDEPLSNLDRELRETMVNELADLIAALGLTAIYVTHDQGEALTLADQVAVMKAGTIVQLAPPHRLIEEPASADVAEFLRLGTIARMRRAGGGWAVGNLRVSLTGGPDAAEADALLTPRALAVNSPEAAALTARVTSVQYRDMAYAIGVRVEGAPLDLQVSSDIRLRIGERVGLTIFSDRIRWFPAEPSLSGQ